jgi:lipopolysaccharide transport system ATP-binding protein
MSQKIIEMNNLCVDFKLYGISRSLRKIALNSLIGGSYKDINNELVLRALNNINLSINKGEKIGLIGSNGSGKSTLLKVLAGIYVPVSGSMSVIGEVGSLIDISAGIEPEANSLINIRLLGLARGRTLKELKNLEESIVDFSDLKEHINLPFKNLSTGMSMRLLFSVATTIVPDILILDELIGTGDENFKKKASKRLNEIVSENKTLVLASHDLNLLERTCNRILILNRGTLVYDGNVNDAIDFVKNKNIKLETL